MEDRRRRDAGGADPLDRLTRAVLAWREVPHACPGADREAVEKDAITVDRAKGALMLRYGVNSHVALAMLVRWSRDADMSITVVSRALVDGAVRTGRLPGDQHQIGEWLRVRHMDIN